MTLDYYVYEIKQMLPDESRYLDNRLIIRWIDLNRAIWIKNEYNKTSEINKSFKQSIYLEVVPKDQSTIIDIPTNSRILKSTKEIPDLVFKDDLKSIVSVRNAKIISERYNFITREQAVYAGNGKVNTKSVFVFIQDKYLYIKLLRDNPKIAMLTHVILEGYFNNPNDVSDYINGNGLPCFNPLKEDYPMDDVLWGYMREQIINNGLLVIQSNKIEENESK